VRRTLTDITRQMIHATLWGGVIFFNIKIDIHVISMLYKEMEKIKNLIIKKTMFYCYSSDPENKQNKTKYYQASISCLHPHN